MIKILFIADIVGEPGRLILRRVQEYRQKYNPDLIFANAENAAGGNGITPNIVKELLSYGINGMTLGNHAWDRKEVYQIIDDDRIVRPLNYPEGTPGAGYRFFKTISGKEICLMNLLGRVFIANLDCPFRTIEKELEKIKIISDIFIVDFHAEVTSEKIAMGWFLDGRVSAVIGTHTHVVTADERILPGGTAYITDAGMTGPFDSVIGIQKEQIIKKFLTQIPIRYEVARDDIRSNMVYVEIDESTGKATLIKRFEEKY